MISEQNNETPLEKEVSGEAIDEISEGIEETGESEITPSADEASENAQKTDTDANYSLLMKSDLEALKKEFPELRDMDSISELDNPLRYGALRDLGLTPSEAYLATAKRHKAQDTRSHLQSSVPKFASMPRGTMSEGELASAREIFSGLSDAEIKKLYRKVTV